MIRRLTKPVAVYRAYKINLSKHKKIKKLAKAMELGTLGTLAAVQTGSLLKSPMIDQFVKPAAQKSSLVISKLPKHSQIGPMPYIEPDIKSFRNELFKIPAPTYSRAVYTYTPVYTSMKDQVLQRRILIKIMDEDKNLPKGFNKDKCASTIMNIALELGADPISIACIIKQETHFHSGLNGKNGKGLMQLTSITIKDMYTKGRDRLYHSALNELKKNHPTSSSLFTALQTQDSINVKVGALAYMMRLQESKGNIKNALRNYNGSQYKETYAKEVFRNIQKYTTEFKELQKAAGEANKAV